MSPVSSRAGLAAGVAVALGLTVTTAAVTVLAGSLGGQPPTNTTRPECPIPGSATDLDSGRRTAWLPPPAPEGDNQAQHEATRPAPAEVDTQAGCAPPDPDTSSGSDSGG